MGCRGSILLYSDTGEGKTTQVGSWARWVNKTTGKKVRYYTEEPGGIDSVAHIVDAGLLEVCDLSPYPNPTEAIEFASQGYWPDSSGRLIPPTAKTWDEIAGIAHEGGTSYAECLMEELRNKAAANEIVGAEKPP